ncbi:MAG: hypothetical protein M3011_00330, partial [Actinomycetota bacterium]|nr:hypothetical protein [Actinomycetota bacterium]
MIITGTDFTAGTTVKFGATTASPLHIDGPTQLTVTSPAGTGTVDVTVNTPSGTSATGAGDRFTYVTVPPSTTSTTTTLPPTKAAPTIVTTASASVTVG